MPILDYNSFQLLNGLAGRSSFSNLLIVFFGNYLAYVLVAVFLVFLIMNGKKFREKFYMFIVVFAAAGISRFAIAEVIRFFYYRPRPFLVHQTAQLLSENSSSFPSGHASFFFAFSMAIYLYNKKWGIWFFIASAVMGMARVAAGVHYPSDILGGAVIGIATGYLVFKLGRAIIFKTKTAS